MRRGSTGQWHYLSQMFDLLDNSILSSSQKLKHLLKASAFALKKPNVIVVPVQSLKMIVSLVFVEVHSGIGGQGEGIAEVVG